MTDVTIADVERFAQTPIDKINARIYRYRFQGASSDAFAGLINDAIDAIVSELVENRDLIAQDGEDSLTSRIVVSLRMLGLTASREASVNGHCDISVKGFGQLWLGEAKIYTSYDKLMKGFQQLCDRYSPGTNNSDKGGLIIYFRTGNILNVMAAWSVYLCEVVSDIVVTPDLANPLGLWSSHEHQSTGLPYLVRHIPVPLFYSTTDDKARPRRKAGTRRASKLKVVSS